ncbi:hypothetical protein SAMN05443428_1168 [Caloramator quimbayensis]|uniref:Uncharacterized protein n=1 Tax=Caloramator quimbayensis TaxID=1147123 RepID=A0A1T4XZJ4_9CLOT|nr:hypothetical protein SAMN05443428_1168 [Caloramator quimbayensis]
MLYLFYLINIFKGVIIIYQLVKIENNNNIYKETFNNLDNKSRIRTITYTYKGNEDNLNDFLYKIIFDYAKENKIID